MTKAQKRVQIAKDVLKQLRIGRLKPKKGVYVEPKTAINIKSVEPDIQVQKLIKDKACKVCALGSLMVCAIDRFNKLKLSETSSYSKLDIFDRTYLMKFFSYNQLEFMEAAFEGWYGGGCDLFSPKLPNKERLTRIMKNVIRNKGTFIPEQEKKKVKND